MEQTWALIYISTIIAVAVTIWLCNSEVEVTVKSRPRTRNMRSEKRNKKADKEFNRLKVVAKFIAKFLADIAVNVIGGFLLYLITLAMTR